ncbi:MAG: hypothetical protein NTX23_03020 [Candidatus Bipolaricaulota bacterium]|nr:hypothetical protein [Candidatus Bipolaricaulota bacterium]
MTYWQIKVLVAVICGAACLIALVAIIATLPKKQRSIPTEAYPSPAKLPSLHWKFLGQLVSGFILGLLAYGFWVGGQAFLRYLERTGAFHALFVPAAWMMILVAYGMIVLGGVGLIGTPLWIVYVTVRYIRRQ